MLQTGRLRLIVFDCDGTLVDSQQAIITAATGACEAAQLPWPGRAAMLRTVGLSLHDAASWLFPNACDGARAHFVAVYKAGYADQRTAALRGAAAGEMLYPGAKVLLEELARQPRTLLGMATGKSRRGVQSVLTTFGLEGVFQTIQTADTNRSKPDPEMLRNACCACGVDVESTLMVGDTTHDLEMAAAAGVQAVGVTWGYHSRDDLSAIHDGPLVNDMAELTTALGA